MKKVLVEVSFVGHNFCAYVPELPGCISTGDTPETLKLGIKEAIEFHVESSLEDDDPIPDKFKGNYELAYRFDTQSLLKYYEGIFTKSALERITGINQRQLSHYANDVKKPRPITKKKIEAALHNLGKELLAVDL